ncbi:MAG: D-alanine--D-alanine ligase [Deltaproteobacteria bacterium]|nr:D-alanine--D-alanine ligase [Deltaproteobacteria bacterium]
MTAPSGSHRSRRVGVLYGGPSAEREVSLVSGKEVADALRQRGYKGVSLIDVGPDLPAQLRKRRIDVVFNALHGKVGEDGCVQGLLEVMGIPYTGSGVTASALCMDKVLTKEVLVRNRIPTPPYQVLAGKGHVTVKLPLPVVVKPRSEGSSIGVTIVRRQRDVASAVREACRSDRDALVESYVPGKEITVGILNGEALGVTEIRPAKGFYDFKTKYTSGMASHVFPAPLPGPLYRKAMRLAARTCALLGCEGAPRVDFRISPEQRLYALEVNTLPGMTPLSLLPEIAAGVGMDFGNLVERILDRAALKNAAAGQARETANG